MNLKRSWTHLDSPSLGLTVSLSEIFQRIDLTSVSDLPLLHRGDIFYMGSDYSSSHKRSDYECFGFISTCSQSFEQWRAEHHYFRLRYLPDKRRISFKDLSDRRVADALPFFLNLCNQMNAFLSVFLVHKDIGTLCDPPSTKEEDDDELPASFLHWKPRVYERFQCIISLASMLLAGLSREGQDVFWFTDRDEVVANEDRHRQFLSSFVQVVGHHLKHRLGRLRIGTTASDSGQRDLEDFVAIADLAIGAVGELVTCHNRLKTPLLEGVALPPPSGLRAKSLKLMNWLANPRSQLKKVFITIEPVGASKALKLGRIVLN